MMRPWRSVVSYRLELRRGLAQAAAPTTRSAFAVGFGVNGALGNGSTARLEVPVKVQGGELLQNEPIEMVASGWGHSAILTSSGDVCLFGRTHDVQQAVRFGRMAMNQSLFLQVLEMLGSNNSIDALFPQRLMDYVTNPGEKGEPKKKELIDLIIEIPSVEKDRPFIKHVSCSAGLTALLTDQGKLYTLGSNQFGQCGHGRRDLFVYLPTPVQGFPENDNCVVQVGLGFRHGVALTSKGNVYTWGKGQRGQLGHGRQGIRDVLVAKRVEGFGASKVKQVTAGFNHCLALTTDGHVMSWGKFQTLGQSEDGGLVVEDLLEPTRVHFPEGVNVQKIWSGQHHNVALSSTNELYQWGRISDKLDSSNREVLEQSEANLARVTSSSMKMQQLVRLTILKPVKVNIAPEFTLSPNFSIDLGFENSLLLCDDLDVPFFWDWNLNPLPLSLHEPGMDDFFREHKVKQISQGWQHMLFVAEPRN